MKLLEDRILRDGMTAGPGVLKVDSFLNHQIDVAFLDKLGEELARLFSDSGATKILTVEASGIALACAAARVMKLPVVFAKKGNRRNVGADVFAADCRSFTHGTDYLMTVSRSYLSSGDTILIIDDFLADGNAMRALLTITKEAGAAVCGIGIAIEKGFQGGGAYLRGEGYRLRSLAVIESMNDGNIVFGRENP